MHAAQQFDEQAVCEGCGCFGAYDFGGQRLCAQCYAERGSCCSEFGSPEPQVCDRKQPPKDIERQGSGQGE